MRRPVGNVREARERLQQIADLLGCPASDLPSDPGGVQLIAELLRIWPHLNEGQRCAIVAFARVEAFPQGDLGAQELSGPISSSPV